MKGFFWVTVWESLKLWWQGSVVVAGHSIYSRKVEADEGSCSTYIIFLIQSRIPT